MFCNGGQTVDVVVVVVVVVVPTDSTQQRGCAISISVRLISASRFSKIMSLEHTVSATCNQRKLSYVVRVDFMLRDFCTLLIFL